MKAKILILIVASYFVDLLFTLFEFEACTVKPWHMFYYGEDLACGHWNGWVSDSSFAYGFFAMGSRALIFLAAWLAIRHGMLANVFMVCICIEAADALDYYLVRNGWWQFIPPFNAFGFENIKFEFNYVKICFITCYAVYEYRKDS